MLLFLRILFSIITVAIAGYGLITKNFEFQKHMILFLGLSMMVTGMHVSKNKKSNYSPYERNKSVNRK